MQLDAELTRREEQGETTYFEQPLDLFAMELRGNVEYLDLDTYPHPSTTADHQTGYPPTPPHDDEASAETVTVDDGANAASRATPDTAAAAAGLEKMTTGATVMATVQQVSVKKEAPQQKAKRRMKSTAKRTPPHKAHRRRTTPKRFSTTKPQHQQHQVKQQLHRRGPNVLFPPPMTHQKRRPNAKLVKWWMVEDKKKKTGNEHEDSVSGMMEEEGARESAALAAAPDSRVDVDDVGVMEEIDEGVVGRAAEGIHALAATQMNDLESPLDTPRETLKNGAIGGWNNNDKSDRNAAATNTVEADALLATEMKRENQMNSLRVKFSVQQDTVFDYQADDGLDGEASRAHPYPLSGPADSLAQQQRQVNSITEEAEGRENMEAERRSEREGRGSGTPPGLVASHEFVSHVVNQLIVHEDVEETTTNTLPLGQQEPRVELELAEGEMDGAEEGADVDREEEEEIVETTEGEMDDVMTMTAAEVAGAVAVVSVAAAAIDSSGRPLMDRTAIGAPPTTADPPPSTEADANVAAAAVDNKKKAENKDAAAERLALGGEVEAVSDVDHTCSTPPNTPTVPGSTLPASPGEAITPRSVRQILRRSALPQTGHQSEQQWRQHSLSQQQRELLQRSQCLPSVATAVADVVADFASPPLTEAPEPLDDRNEHEIGIRQDMHHVDGLSRYLPFLEDIRRADDTRCTVQELKGEVERLRTDVSRIADIICAAREDERRHHEQHQRDIAAMRQMMDEVVGSLKKSFWARDEEEEGQHKCGVPRVFPSSVAAAAAAAARASGHTVRTAPVSRLGC